MSYEKIRSIIKRTERSIESLYGGPVRVTFEPIEVRISLNSIISAVCVEFDVTLDELRSDSRNSNLVDARCAYAWISYKHINRSMPKIANKIRRGPCHYLVKRANDLMDINDPIKSKILRIENQLLNNKQNA